MNYQESMDYIEEIMKTGSIMGLESMKELLRRLENPQDNLRFIHLAGTNGKGSTLAFLSAILMAAGYRTGCYISPVLTGYRERIQVNGRWISEQAVAAGLTKIRAASDSMAADGLPRPTAFEVETALGFLYFAAEACDIVVLETGLGGSEDATNVVKTVVCSVITPISLDHMSILGDSIEAITACKAGIIKPRVPVVLARQSEAAVKVIRSVCMEQDSPLWVTAPPKALEGPGKTETQCFDYRVWKRLEIALMGPFQIDNAAVAAEVIRVIGGYGYQVSETALRSGLLMARWHGRFERIAQNPDLYIDGAHNEAGAVRLMEAVDLYFTNRRLLYIMGVLQDKDYARIIELTAHRAARIFTITPANSRGLSAGKLAAEIGRVNPNVNSCETLKDALAAAREAADQEDVILAFGSLSFLGDLMKLVQEKAYDR